MASITQSNKVKFNLKNVHYALKNEAEDGVITYGTPKKWPGAVSLSLSPEGDTNKFYADGISYYTSTANNGYTGDFESALVPDDFLVDVLGEIIDETSKVQIENANAVAKEFAFLFEFDGDKKGTRHVLYNCTASRPNVEGETVSDTKEPKTESISITVSPLPDGMVKAKTAVDTSDSVYSAWYSEVWMPTLSKKAEG